MSENVISSSKNVVSKLLYVKDEYWLSVAPAATELISKLINAFWCQTLNGQLVEEDEGERNCIFLFDRCLKTEGCLKKIGPVTVMQFLACFLLSSQNHAYAWSVCRQIPSDDMAFKFTKCFQNSQQFRDANFCKLVLVWTVCQCVSSTVYYPAILDLLPVLSDLVKEMEKDPASLQAKENEFWLKKLIQTSLHHSSDNSLVFYLEMLLDSLDLRNCIYVVFEDEALFRRLKDIGNPEIRMMLDSGLRDWRKQRGGRSSSHVALKGINKVVNINPGDVKSLIELFPQLSVEEAVEHLSASLGNIDAACESVITSSLPEELDSSTHSPIYTKPNVDSMHKQPKKAIAPLSLSSSVTAVISNRTSDKKTRSTVAEEDDITHLNISPDRLYLNKKPEDLNFWKKSVPETDKSRVLNLLAMAEDDEYDDTYDDLDTTGPVDSGVGDDDPEASSKDAHDFQKFINQTLYDFYQQNPEVFDQKARKSKERADLLAKLDNSLTHEQIEGWRRMFTTDSKFAEAVKKEVTFGSGNTNIGSLRQTKFKQSNYTPPELNDGSRQHRPSRPSKNPSLKKKKYVRTKPKKASNEK